MKAKKISSVDGIEGSKVKFNVQPRSQVICRMLFLDILANLQKKKLRWSPSFSKITGFVQ